MCNWNEKDLLLMALLSDTSSLQDNYNKEEDVPTFDDHETHSFTVQHKLQQVSYQKPQYISERVISKSL